MEVNFLLFTFNIKLQLNQFIIKPALLLIKSLLTLKKVNFKNWLWECIVHSTQQFINYFINKLFLHLLEYSCCNVSTTYVIRLPVRKLSKNISALKKVCPNIHRNRPINIKVAHTAFEKADAVNKTVSKQIYNFNTNTKNIYIQQIHI